MSIATTIAQPAQDFNNNMAMDTLPDDFMDIDTSNPLRGGADFAAKISFLMMQVMMRKRKRRDLDDDNVSVQSLNLSADASQSDKKSHKKRSLAKMSSLANILSPATNKVQKAFERSFSFKTPISPAYNQAHSSGATPKQITPYKKPKPAASERRHTKFWSETVEQDLLQTITSQEIKRQEAIHEIVEGERDLIEDLTMVHKLYHNSMKKLNLLNDGELDSIFGIVERLVPIHQELQEQLVQLRNSNGVIEQIGSCLIKWAGRLEQYETYCANQVYAKSLLDNKKTDHKVEDFLMRCQESSFSRKLDLWSFLDLPRSRLVKYPLLLKQVHKYTAEDHEDRAVLSSVIDNIEKTIQAVDKKMGESKCKHAIDSLLFLEESEKQTALINECTSVLCSGQLKNDRGTKIQVFLFDGALVVARQATRNGQLKYQVSKPIIAIEELALSDLAEGEGRKGSFKNKVLRHPTTDKNTFRVWSTATDSSSHLLHTKDEHDKRQWVTCIQKAIERATPRTVQVEQTLTYHSSSSSLGSGIDLSSSEEESLGETQLKVKVETVV